MGEAANRRDLVAVCLAEQPDLVLTDLQMQKKSGIEAATEIAETSTIPFIVVSSYERPTDQDVGLIADYLVKPVCSSEL